MVITSEGLDASVVAFMEKFIREREKMMSLSLDQQRKSSKAWWLSHSGPIPEIGGVMDTRINGSYGAIPLKIFLPKGKPPFPLIIYFHRGGWVYGGNEESAAICSQLVESTQYAVASVEYPLSPESKFPSAVDECYNAIKWLKGHSDDFGLDKNSFYVCGESAGGNLAAVAALIAKENGGMDLAGQILIYPILNHEIHPEDYEGSLDKYLITIENMQWFWQQYLEKPEDGLNAYASPLLAEDLRELPRTLIICAEHDPLTKDAERYAQRLSDAGVSVELKVYAGTVHGFMDMPICQHQRAETLKDVDSWIKGRTNP